MPGMMPNMPEAVTYHEYEAMRDQGIPPTSVYEGRPYTVRFRVKEQFVSKDLYAYDMLGVILKVRHLGQYSIIGAKIRHTIGVDKSEFGLSHNGIAFIPEPLPDDFEFIPYKSELGYIVGDADGNSRSADHADTSEEIRYAEQLLAVSR